MTSVRVTLDVMLARRKMRARDVAERILNCMPEEILEYDRDDADLASNDD
jgi:DNA-binding Xre family transcriptional regulator